MGEYLIDGVGPYLDGFHNALAHQPQHFCFFFNQFLRVWLKKDFQFNFFEKNNLT